MSNTKSNYHFYPSQNVKFDLTNIVPANKLSVFLQIIQYFVITCAEIMFSVTGLEFSYSQVRPQTL